MVWKKWYEKDRGGRNYESGGGRNYDSGSSDNDSCGRNCDKGADQCKEPNSFSLQMLQVLFDSSAVARWQLQSLLQFGV